jgi:hypothetical protein
VSAGGPLELVVAIARILDELAIPYAVGGSVASSFFGEPRATADVDVAISVTPDVGEAARRALQTHDSFNLVSTSSALKVDVFVLGADLLDRRQIERRVPMRVPGAELQVWVTSAEDQVLRKLSWFRAGGSASDRQWRDVLGLLRVSGAHLDLRYLQITATELHLDDLLAQAIAESADDG